uniref:HTH luxR-type domain-containing protein n=1 Tax=Aromatoleum anaerobium TaxID=182180 RepID=A0ABX1PUV7_9RHOO
MISDEPWLLQEQFDEIARRNRSIPAPYLDRIREAGSYLSRQSASLVTPPPLPNPLTSRESSLLRLVVDGRANKEIARLLGISENTVESHLRRINQKLNTHNRTQAIARAREIGLLH